MIAARIRRKLARAAHERRRHGALRAPFSGRTARRLLLLSVDHRIPQSQIFPFHHYAPAFRDRRDTEIREVEIGTYLQGGAALPEDATTVAFQTAFDISPDDLDALFAAIRARNPRARLAYLDWFAPTDLRLAHRVGPRVDNYVTKHLLRDRARYERPVYGDTTLMEHYGHSVGLHHEQTHFPIPDGFWNKLVLGPSFVTADFMLPAFARGRRPRGARPIDLHARLAVAGSPWYAAMRGQCQTAVAALTGLHVVTGTGVGHHRFLSELRRAKTCFSPFGYGEVCWRDFEAVLCGAVLLKQDMSHVQTDPDIFEAGETYVPVAWDLSDLDEKVHWLARDAAARDRIAGAAFDRLRDYARSARFVDQMAPLLV